MIKAVKVNEAFSKLERLSPERAQRIVAMIEDFAELEMLEALEDAEDIAAADAALARIEAGDKPVPWEQVKAEANELHGIR